MKILMVLTSHDQLGSTGRKTGFWLEELAAPYYVFKDAAAQITLASPKGGRPPLDPKSQDPSFQTDITRRFEKDAQAEAQLDETLRLGNVRQEDYDTVFYPGGHGPMWDLAEDPNSVELIESFLAAGKPVALVCHAPGVLRHVKTLAGTPLVAGRNVTGFTDGEEADVGLTRIVPFLVEDELLGLGAIYSKVRNWGVHTVTDGLLITGQNPASSGPAATVLIDTLQGSTPSRSDPKATAITPVISTHERESPWSPST
jgi:putative intracellular protease/amidase